MASTWPQRLSPYGLWTHSRQWPTDLAEAGDAAAEIEALGFGALWIGVSNLPFELHEALLQSTSRLIVATGVVNVWTNAANDVARRYHELAAHYPGRFLLGLGASHARTVQAAGMTYAKPYSKVAAYLDELDELDAGEPPVPAGDRVLAALRPRMLRLASDRAAGAHPYLMPPEHTASARTLLGPEPLLAPEQKVLLHGDPDEAWRASRQMLAPYLELPNYTGMLTRYGLTEDDFARGGSDRCIDHLVAWGDPTAVDARVQAHLDAGADHVALNVLNARDPAALPRAEWRSAADMLALTPR